jgi:hypothetical protein
MKKIINNILRLTRAWLMVALCVSFGSGLLASDSIASSSIFDVIAHKEVVSISLEGDIKHLRENKRSKKEVKGKLSFTDASGTERVFNTNITIRGKYRRMFSEGVPPLRLDFKKKDLEAEGLSKYDDLKMVTMFHEDKKEAYQTLVKEYLAYKLYNEITNLSYRVQLIEVSYVDTATEKTEKEYGFLIEDGAQFADRHQMIKIDDVQNIDQSKYDKRQLEILAVFQYMIGNGDWNLDMVKNIKLYKKEGMIIPVPYDFDFCGMVDASYAVPNNIHNINNVKERVYLGGVESIEDLSGIIEIFKAKKDDLLKIISECKFLSEENKKITTDYLISFYEDMSYRKTNDAPMNKTLRTIISGR